jgi:hypothetical protein
MCAEIESASNGTSAPVTDARRIMEGTWQLQEWDVAGNLLRPPQADGRFSLHDNVVIFAGQWTLGHTTHSRYAYGTYTFIEKTWSYQYLHDTVLDETGDGLKVSHDLPWHGARTFSIRVDDKTVVLENEGGRHKLILSADQFLYLEDGRLVRKWTKVLPLPRRLNRNSLAHALQRNPLSNA